MAIEDILGTNPGPGVTTIDSLLKQLLMQVLGDIPGSSQLANIAGNQLFNILGISNDVARNAVLFTNMTPYGAQMKQLQNTLSSAANRSLQQFQGSAREEFYRDVVRTLKSFESWNKEQGGNGTYDQYEQYVNNAAAGYASNFLGSMLYNAIDPDGLAQAAPFLSKASANEARLNLGQGIRASYSIAADLGKIFLNDKNQVDYDKRDYGGMTMGETSAVLASLTRDLNYYQDIDSNNPDQIRDATQRLKDTLKKYTEALAPLKDVFGNDVPKMIRALQDLTGKTLASIDPDAAKGMTERIMNGVMAGDYSLEQLMTSNKEVRKAMGQMNIPYTFEAGALFTAKDITTAAFSAGATRPVMMTDTRFQNEVTQYLLRTGNSRGADAMNMAYALYRRANPEKTIEDFRNEYNALREGTDQQPALNQTEAILRMAGVANMSQLAAEAYRTEEYRQNIRDGIGQSLAGREVLQENFRQIARNHQELVPAIEALKQDLRLISMVDNQTELVRRLGDLGYNSQQITQVVEGLNTLNNSPAYKQFVTQVAAQDTLERQNRREAEVGKRRTLLSSVLNDKEVAADFMEFGRQFLAGRDVKDIVDWTVKLGTVADPEVKKDLEAISLLMVQREEQARREVWGDTKVEEVSEEVRKENESKIKKIIDKKRTELITYSMDSGLGDEFFQRQMKAARAVQQDRAEGRITAEEAAVKIQRINALVDASRETNPEKMQRFLERGELDEEAIAKSVWGDQWEARDKVTKEERAEKDAEVRRRITEKREEIRTKNETELLTEWQRTQAKDYKGPKFNAAQYIDRVMVNEKLTELKDVNAISQGLYEKLTEVTKTGYDRKEINNVLETWKKEELKKENVDKTEVQRQIDTAKGAINQVIQGNSNPLPSMSDIFDMVPKVLDELSELVGADKELGKEIRALVTQNQHKQPQDSNTPGSGSQNTQGAGS